MKQGQIFYLIPDPAFPSHNLGNIYHYFYGILIPYVNQLQNFGIQLQPIPFYESYQFKFTKEFLSILGLKNYLVPIEDYQIVTEHQDLIYIPRWDYHVLSLSWSRYQSEYYHGFVERLSIKYPKITLFKDLEKDSKSIENQLRSDLELIRNRILSSIDLQAENPFKNKVLLIDRAPVSSEIHRSEFYKWRGYGKHSRNIMNMDALEQALLKKGVPVYRFTPGNESLLTQIMAFASCSGVIALRGAELMHALWMPIKAKSVVIETRDILPGCSFSRIMSDWLDHDYHEIEVRQGRFVNIDPDLVLSCFN